MRRPVRRRGLLSLAAALALAAGVITASAQSAAVDGIFNRFSNLYAAGNYAAALDEAKTYEAWIRAEFGTAGPQYATALYNLAITYYLLERHAEAQEHNRRALAIREQALGSNHALVATTLNSLAQSDIALGRYADAETRLKRALAIIEKAASLDQREIASTLSNLAIAVHEQGRYADAETHYKRALDLREKLFGADHALVAQTLSNLGALYEAQGRFALAESALKRALTIKERTHGTDHIETAFTLNNLAGVYDSLGRLGEAETLYRRALTIKEKAVGANHPNLTSTLDGLGNIFKSQGRYPEAEGLYRRALTIIEATRGSAHPDLALTLGNLGSAYLAQDKMTEAVAAFQRALAIQEKTSSATDPALATTLNNLAAGFNKQKKYAEAAPLYQRALGIREKALGSTHPEVATTTYNLAGLLENQGKFAEAERLHLRALDISRKAFGPHHPEVAQSHRGLAKTYVAWRQNEKALASIRAATAAVIAHAASEPSGIQRGDTQGLVDRRADYFHFHLAGLDFAARAAVEPSASLAREAFEVAQWASSSSAAAAVQQMATRFAAGSGELATLVREIQDRAKAKQVDDKALIAGLAKPESQQDRAANERLRRQAAEHDARIAALSAQIDRQFPDFAALARPKPLKADEAQALLGPDEALVLFLGSQQASYVVAVTRTDVAWAKIPLSGEALGPKVAAFRRGLDIDQINRARAQRQAPQLFDLALSSELYAALLKPVEALVKDKRHLLVVPTGALTALPFQLLVSEPATTPKDFAAYRDAAWLVKRHTVTVLPSAASLKALRATARRDQARLAMIGFGDPVFGPEPAAPAGVRVAKVAARKVATRSFADFWQGAGVDRDSLAKALPRLEDTADELNAVAKKLGAAARDIFLRARATEANVKQAKLADYRVVYFATHGLVAGDVKGLAEPSLVLTIPGTPSDADDGLLTASEVAQLKLNADWVVLSACNTIAGDKPGAEALSGLARAFFYAGARALLVSHWAVDSAAATRLTIATFDAMARDPKIGRAEALRQAMLAMMNDTSDPKNAYPAYWAPFALIGEGAAK